MAKHPSVPTMPPTSAVEVLLATEDEGHAQRAPKSLAQWRKAQVSLIRQRFRLRQTLALRGVLAQPMRRISAHRPSRASSRAPACGIQGQRTFRAAGGISFAGPYPSVLS